MFHGLLSVVAFLAETCPPGQAMCLDTACIDESWFCDEFVDCADGSDEMGCPGKKSIQLIIAL